MSSLPQSPVSLTSSSLTGLTRPVSCPMLHPSSKKEPPVLVSRRLANYLVDSDSLTPCLFFKPTYLPTHSHGFICFIHRMPLRLSGTLPQILYPIPLILSSPSSTWSFCWIICPWHHIDCLILTGIRTWLGPNDQEPGRLGLQAGTSKRS